MPIWKKSKSKQLAAGPGSPAADNVFRLGKTTKLKGELAASADVEIEGQVEGKVQIDGYVLVVTESGRAIVDIVAREVVVRGQVVGNVSASERIVIEPSGSVLGDICAPSIQLANGSRFTGSINKESAPAKVTGQLSGNSAKTSQTPQQRTSQALMRRQSVTDRRGSDRPWGLESRRKPSPRPSEPTPTA